MGKRELIIFLIGISLFLILPSLILAEEFDYNYLEGELNVAQAVNYTEVSVNDSTYWDGHAFSWLDRFYLKSNPFNFYNSTTFSESDPYWTSNWTTFFYPYGTRSLRIGAGSDASGTQAMVIGYQAGSNQNGICAIGYQAGLNNTKVNTVQIGYQAGLRNTGSYQTAIGYLAGADNTIYYQTALGAHAGRENTGSYSSQFGFYAGYQNTGASQTTFGYNSGRANSGSNQVSLGRYAGNGNKGDFQVAVGRHAGYNNEGNHQTVLGYYSGADNDGNYTIGIGYEATRTNLGDNVVAIGYQAGKTNSLHDWFFLQQANVNAVPLIQGNFSSGEVWINGSLYAGSVISQGINLTALNSTGLVKNWNATGLIQNYESGAEPNWNANYSDFLTISAWNNTGLIKNWNASGFINNWQTNINSANTSLYNWVVGQNYINEESEWKANSTLVPYLASENTFTANQNMSNHNITNVQCIKFQNGASWCGI